MAEQDVHDGIVVLHPVTVNGMDTGRTALSQEAFQPANRNVAPGPEEPPGFLETKIGEWIDDYQFQRELEAGWAQQDHDKARRAITLEPNTVRETFEMCLNEMDADRDGRLTGAEIEWNKRHCPDADGSVLKALSLYAHDIEEQVNDEFGDENSGISQQDIERLTNEWDTDNSFDLVRRVNYVGNIDSFTDYYSAFHSYQFDLRKSWERGGAITGSAVGLLGGAVLTDLTGGLAAPLIVVGAMAGARPGAYVGYKLGEYRADLASPDRFIRSLVDKKLKLD